MDELATPLRSGPKRRRIMDVDVWLSLPTELLVDVFRRLDATDVVSCAGTCKPWRRTIIGNASCLRPRPDRFNPNLLLGFVYQCEGAFLQRVTGPFQSTLPASTGGKEGCCEKPCDLFPATAAAGVDLALYNWPLSSRDGFLLLESLSSRDVVDLCLCNPLTGVSELLPTAAFEADAYILVTGCDLSTSEFDEVAVQIVAVKSDFHDNTTIRYQQYFSSTSSSGTGSWGPVKRSLEVKEHLVVSVSPGREVVCGDTIYWLGFSIASIVPSYSIAAMDVRTGRAWTIELPNECRRIRSHVLATTGDGLLSLLCDSKHFGYSDHIQVSVHANGAQWILQRKIHVPNLYFWNDIFFPRSGCLLVKENGGRALLIDIETGSSRQIMCPHATMLNYGGVSRYPYEIDWSTYLSKMNSFATTASGRISSKPMKRRAWRPNPKIYGANWVNFD